MNKLGSVSIIKTMFKVGKVKGFPSKLIVSWDKSLEDAFRKRYASVTVCTVNCGVRLPVLKNGEDLGFCLIPCGSPAAAVFLEITKKMGAGKYVFAGSCGLLDSSFEKPFVIPSDAFADEGTSRHYGIDGEFVVLKGFAKVEHVFENSGLPYGKGRVWTTDALFAESPEEIAMARSKGCVCVDMECSAIAAVSNVKNLETYQFFYTADVIDPGKSAKWAVSDDIYGKVLDRAVEILQI